MISKHNLTILKRLAEEVLDHANQPMNNLPYMKRDVRAAIEEAQHYIDNAYNTEPQIGYKKALEHYANPKNWENGGFWHNHVYYSGELCFIDTNDPGYKIAQEALSQ